MKRRMRRNEIPLDPWSISFFTLRDKIEVQHYALGESFESPTRTLHDIGQASLIFQKFRTNDSGFLYNGEEKAYAVDKRGNFFIASIKDLVQEDYFELFIMVTATKKVEEDQTICNFWIKNKKTTLSTYLEFKPNNYYYSTIFFGGFTWWSPDNLDVKVKKLFLPKRIRVLSNLCVSLETLPRQFQKKEQDAFLEDDESMYYW